MSIRTGVLVELKHKSFAEISRWWRGWTKSRNERRFLSDALPLPSELEGRRIHPALHFEEDFTSVSIVDDLGAAWVVTSNRKQLPVSDLETALIVKPLPYRGVRARWDQENFAGFLAGGHQR